MIAMALVGALIGLLLFAIVLRLIGVRTSPLVQLGQLDARYQGTLRVAGPVERLGPGSSLQGRFGALATAELTRRGFTYTPLRQDLALSGKEFSAVMGRKVVAAIAGLLLALFTIVTVQLSAGLALPLGVPIVLAFLAGAGFFFLPDLEARRQATGRRRDFRRALGAYLDLVALEMAGAAAPEQALTSAARVGAGWPMALLRDTLFRATRSGNDQWTALSELGTRIGVPELRDLGALVRLVGKDGARVRQTLTARAATMRRRELADAEGQAGERDEAMRMAQVVIGFGFVVFLSYPAVVNVLSF